MILLALLAACQPTDPWSAAEELARPAAPPPPYELRLTASNFVAGAPMQITVSGGPPGATVYFAWSGDGLGAGVCPPALGGRCTDIRPTVHPLPMTRTLNNTGSATLSAMLPAQLGGRYLAVQAAVLGPNVRLSNPVGRPVGPTGTAIQPTADLDGDGISVQGGDCADFDPSFAPGLLDPAGDGLDQDCDDLDGNDLDGDGASWFVDCDDANPAAFPGNAETWYDGVDGDCLGDDDYDRDADGHRSDRHGGDDCADTDPSRTTCACRHAPAAALEALNLHGASDIQYRYDCSAVVPSILNGGDELNIIDADGLRTVHAGYANHDMTAAVPLDDGSVALAQNNDQTCFVGLFDRVSTSVLWQGVWTQSSLWGNHLLNRCASSIAADSECLWIPNLNGDGELACLGRDTGVLFPYVQAGQHIDAVVVHPTRGLLYAAGPAILEAGTLTTLYMLNANVIDIAIDPRDGALYVETAAQEISRIDANGVTPFAAVSRVGKLAVTPDGWLVRIMPAPTGLPEFEEWPL